jgi:hypothetical protein
MISPRQEHSLGFYRAGFRLFADWKLFDPTLLVGRF